MIDKIKKMFKKTVTKKANKTEWTRFHTYHKGDVVTVDKVAYELVVDDGGMRGFKPDRLSTNVWKEVK